MISVSESCLSLHSLFRYGALILRPNGPSLRPLSWRDYLDFRSLFQPRRLFSLLWLAGYLLLGLTYATTSMLAEWHYAVAWRQIPNFYLVDSHLQTSNDLFPLEYRIREAPVFNYVFNKPPQVPVSLSIEATKRAIKYDPYSATLHVALLKLYSDTKNLDGMRSEFEIIKALIPHSIFVTSLIKAGFK